MAFLQNRMECHVTFHITCFRSDGIGKHGDGLTCLRCARPIRAIGFDRDAATLYDEGRARRHEAIESPLHG